jgi:tetratricopeptide (TPR) repeat protein
MAVPAYSKKKKKKSLRSQVRKYWWLAPVLGGVVTLGWLATGPRWWGPRVLSKSGAPIKGYIGNIDTVKQEYLHFHGKPLKNPAVERLFQLANQRIALQDYESAALLLETVSQDAAVPVIFNDLGVIYAQLNDRSRAINSFREALARDIDYQPVRFNLDRLRAMTANAADPVSREIEPNNSPAYANVITPGKPVEGEIAPGVNDLDYFRITTPPAPRDQLRVTIEPHSPELSPALRIFDSERRLTSMTADVKESGNTLNYLFAPLPNTTFYLQVSASGHSSGNYTLKVVPLRAFDNYEPNDDIFNARRIELGRAIEANIMDSEDTDYYSFIAAHTGPVNVTIHNRSTTLIPALTTYSSEMRNTGFGPDIRTPGAHLRHSFDVVESQMYYIQVWSENNTAGEYSVTIE